MSKTLEEFKELCEQCKNDTNIKYIVFDAYDEFMKDLLMEQQEQM